MLMLEEDNTWHLRPPLLRNSFNILFCPRTSVKCLHGRHKSIPSSLTFPTNIFLPTKSFN